MSSPAAFLVVRTGSLRVGLAVEQLVEVLDPGVVYAVPAREPSVRGVAMVRGRLLPVVHLGALLDGAACPPEIGGTAVLVRLGGSLICLEVDAADAVLREDALPVPADVRLPWAIAVATLDDDFVPILDLRALAARLEDTAP
jgi:chemotaxis signal transduction protein